MLSFEADALAVGDDDAVDVISVVVETADFEVAAVDVIYVVALVVLAAVVVVAAVDVVIVAASFTVVAVGFGATCRS